MGFLSHIADKRAAFLPDVRLFVTGATLARYTREAAAAWFRTLPPALCIATAPRFWAGRISLFVLLLTLLSLLFVPAYLILLAIPPLALVLTGVLYRSLERPAMSLSEPGKQDRCEFGRDIQALCLTPLWLPRRWNPAS